MSFGKFPFHVLGLLAVIAVATPSFAAPHECSVGDFEGRYGFQGIGFNTLNYPVTPLSMAGSIVADGKGTLTYWSDFAHFGLPEGPPKRTEMNDFVAAARSGGHDVTYRVEPDCRMTIVVPLPAPAPTLMIQGVLVDGGRTAQMIIGSPAYVGTWTVRKTDDQLEDLRLVKELLQRIARRQGMLVD